MTPSAARDWVLQTAAELGLARAGVAAVGPTPRAAYLDDWLVRGCAGEMSYLGRYREIRADPARLLPGARSVIVVADLYRQPNTPEPAEHEPTGGEGGPVDSPIPDVSSAADPRGRVAQYAWGRDYHRVLRKKLHALADRMHAAIGEPFETRVCVDTAPIVEREWAALAGVGWIGKNTMVLCSELGSFFFLGEIVTTLELAPTDAAVDRCGSCTRCLEACPTGALTAPYQMDARRCISYLTIEHRGEIPGDLRPLMGDWLYGCDICQDVCPFNRKAPLSHEPAYTPMPGNPLVPRASLEVLNDWSRDDYDRSLTGSAIKRASLEMLKRNAAAIVEGIKKPRASNRAADEIDSPSQTPRGWRARGCE